MTVVQLPSAGIWSPLQLRHSSPYGAPTAHRDSASASPIAAMSSQRASPPPAGDWRTRGAQLQGSVATHMAMARRAEEAAQHRADYAPHSAAAVAAAAARMAAAALGPAVLLSPVAARPLPSSQPLPMRGSFAAPAKLNRRDQLILSTFEWNLKPALAYVPPPAAISPRSAPHDQWQLEQPQQQAQEPRPSGAEDRIRNNMPDGSDNEPQQSHSGNQPLFRSPTRSGGAGHPSLQRSRSVTGSAASSMRRAAGGASGSSGAVRGGASISFAPSMSPLSQRTGDVSSLLGVTGMHTLAGSERAAADRSGRQRDSGASQLQSSYHASAIGVSDSSDLFSSPMAAAGGQHYRAKYGVSPARADAHLAALAHARLQLQKEHAHAHAHARPTYLRPSSSNDYQSSSSNSMLQSDGLSSDLSGGAHPRARSHRSVHAPVSSSDDSRWHSSAADTSSLLTLTHLSDSPHTNSEFW